MVYRGKPSPGCDACRKAKKKCDLARPICSRCQKTTKSCTYRESADFVFFDQSEQVIRRAKAKAKAGTLKADSAATSPHSSFQSSPQSSPASVVDLKNGSTLGAVSIKDYFSYGSSALTLCPTLHVPVETLAMGLFFSQFVASGHFSYLTPIQDRGMGNFKGLQKAMLACGLATLSHRHSDPRALHRARKHYTDAIVLTSSSLQTRERLAEDDTVLTVLLLSLFENLACESRKSIESWKAHIKGATEVLRIRGLQQLESSLGIAIFRELRYQIILDCIWDSRPVPDFLIEWSRVLAHTAEPEILPADKLVQILSRYASLRYTLDSVQDGLGKMATSMHLIQTTSIYQDLLDWFEQTTVDDRWTFTEMHLSGTAHTWKGTYHHYTDPQILRNWNWARSISICLSRTQQALMNAAGEQQTTDTTAFIIERQHMADDLCHSVPYALGICPGQDQSDTVPMLGAFMVIMPLFLAGSVALEQVKGYAPRVRDDCDEQLEYIIENLEYIGGVLGIHWAFGLSMLLKGSVKIEYEPRRQRWIQTHDGTTVL